MSYKNVQQLLTPSTSAAISIKYDGTNSAALTVNTSGDLSIDATGNDVNVAATDVFHVLNDTDASSSTVAACLLAGGLGVAKKLYVGTDSYLPKVYIGATPVEVDMVDNDGTLAANSDLRLPTQKAVKTYVGTTTGTTVNKAIELVPLCFGDNVPFMVKTGMVGMYCFDGALVGELFCKFTLPRDWKYESSLVFEIQWISETLDAGNVNWQLGHSINPLTTNHAVDTTGTLATVVTVANNEAIAKYQQKTVLATVTMTGVVTDDTLVCLQLLRNGDVDTYNHSVYLLSWTCKYQSNRLGS
jgi:hypothetical protein